MEPVPRGGAQKDEFRTMTSKTTEGGVSTAANAPKTKTASKPKPTKKKASKAPPKPAMTEGKTLRDLAEAFLQQLAREDKSDGTIFSYRQELRTAMLELGEETLIASITPDKVQSFYDSARVTKLKSGKPKAKPSIDKSRRVLRLALMYAVEAGWLERRRCRPPTPPIDEMRGAGPG